MENGGELALEDNKRTCKRRITPNVQLEKCGDEGCEFQQVIINYQERGDELIRYRGAAG